MRDELITDPQQIAALAKERYDENWRFRSYVKGWLDWSDKRLDAFVHEVYAEVAAEIDCQACAHCCLVMRIEVDDADAKPLACRLAMAPEAFAERYLEPDEEGHNRFRDVPCAFLEDKRCSVYEDRPADCREFPHLDKEGFRFRLIGVLDNAQYCPLVFNTLERLKARLPYHRRRRERHRW